MLTGMLVAKGVEWSPMRRWPSSRQGGRLSRRQIRALRLLVAIPPHEGSDLIDEAGLGDGLGFGLTDKLTLKAKKAERVFLLGDNTNVPTSKAGSVAHFQAGSSCTTCCGDRRRGGGAAGRRPHQRFIETGFGKAILVDFNYDVQPVPGRFPLPWIGPMTLVGESRLNHLGKLAFKPIYWHLLLPGRSIPLVGSQMSTRGKQMEVLAARTGGH
jgi:sulfide:quinone oxidoreductase